MNANGGLYDNDRALPSLVRERILDLNYQGLGQRAIAREVRTSHTFVRNVIRSYETISSIRIPRANFAEPKIDTNVLEYIEFIQKQIKPSTYASEIQHRLLLDGVAHPNDLPGTSQINRRLREDLLFTKKKLTRCRRLKPKNQEHWIGKTNIYKLYLDIQPVSFISLMNQAPSKRRVIESMEMLESASELLKCSVTHLTRHLQ